MRIWRLAAVLMWLPVSGACTEAPLRVVVSFSILADMVRNVGGDAVDVTTLVGPNSDPHVFEPTPRDAQHVAAADLVIINALHFEGWMDRLIPASGYRGAVVVATRGIVARQVGGAPDPHAWQSLANGHIYVENIRDALIRARPQAATGFSVRAADYLASIDNLHREALAKFQAIPQARRRIMTSHDAFGYFGATYGVIVLAPQGWSTDSEASAASVAGLIKQLKHEHACALFVENIADPRLLERIATEAGVAVGGTLYSDALSLPGTAADSYLKLFAHNLDAITHSLN